MEKLEIQLSKSRNAGIFKHRCLANKVTQKTLDIKWKSNKLEQAIIKKAEHLLIHNRIKCANIKISHPQTEITKTKTSLQKKLDAPTFSNLQNTIFNNRENLPRVQEHPDQEAQVPHLQSLHNDLQDALKDNQHFQHFFDPFCFLKYPEQVGNQPLQEGTNTGRKVFTTERPKICSYPSKYPCHKIYPLPLQVNSMLSLYHDVRRILNT